MHDKMHWKLSFSSRKLAGYHAGHRSQAKISYKTGKKNVSIVIGREKCRLYEMKTQKFVCVRLTEFYTRPDADKRASKTRTRSLVSVE